MAHSSADFGSHMLGLLKNTGPTGPTGHGCDKPLISRDISVTTRAQVPVTTQIDWSQHDRTSGHSLAVDTQSLFVPVTTVTSGTTLFEDTRALELSSLYPSQWYAILTALKAREPVEWMSAERWRYLISDAENFLQQWGSAAHSLGWSALDLFGVHPAAPAARFDVMGLLLILNGAAVLKLTDSAAALRARTGATLTYRRSTERGAVLISEVGI